MSWTEQQNNAIEARNSSVIVSAAAGSGKTAVLTERLVKLLADPDSGVRADRLVVVTFTNDAAAELKKRLDMKLRALINDDPSDQHLLRQQVLLQSAKISTINSFCFELIRDNLTEQGITSGFGVLDEADEAVLRAQAMEELFNYYSESEYEKISFLYDRFCIKNEKPLMEIIDKMDRFLASAAFRDKWLDDAVSEYSRDFRDSAYCRTFMASCLRQMKRAYRIAKENVDLITDAFPDVTGVPAAVKTFAQVQDDCESVFTCMRAFESGRFPEESEIPVFGRRVAVNKNVICDHSLLEVYAARRKMVMDTVKSVTASYSRAEADFAESGEVTQVLAEVLKKYQEIIWQRKCEKNAVSFDDGERLALELLADFDENGNIVQSETALRVAEMYDIIMIDEYQDSNNKQDLIFKLMSKNFGRTADGQPMYGDNAFLVGDVKQSIYGFRLANPKNFIATLKASEPYSAESQAKNKAIFLNRNFRSSPEVIDTVNYIFSRIMSEDCGDIAYDDNEKLYFGAQEYSAHTGDRLTELRFIPDADEEVPSGNAEAACTAKKIAEMLRTGAEVVKKEGGTRLCTPADFCILTRSNGITADFVKELELHGIPAKGSEEKGYLKSREITILLDLLRIISNPLRDIPLAAVLTSPMYTFTIGDIAYIRSFDRKSPLFSVIRDVVGGKYEDFTDMFLIERCADFMEALDAFRLDSVTMTVGELITSIYDTTDFISVMQLYSDGEKKRANLRALVQYAINYETAASAEGFGGLNGFLRHIDRIMENGDYAQGKVSASSGDYVSVQTMHSSKGLEYPFVFIAQTDHKFRYDSDTVMCSADGRVGYILYDPKLVRKYKTFQQIMLAEEKRRDARSEEMRLLYVALTRAKQKLFINLKCGEDAVKRISGLTEECVINNSSIASQVNNADTYADWIWACLMKHRSFGEIAEKTAIDTERFGLPKWDSEDELFSCEYCVPDCSDIITEAAEEREAEPDEALCRELRALINSTYDRELSQMPAKLSVTQLTHKFTDTEEPDMQLQRPRFITGVEKLTGTERGTAIHTFFQYCDLNAARVEPEKEIQRMISAGYLTEAQGRAIDTDKVGAFFDNELYGRLMNSGSYVREKKFMVAVAQLDISGPIIEKLRHSDGMIKGIIDLMFEEKDGLVIVDYKSDRGASADALRERYTAQMQLYRAAAELTTGKKVKEACLYSFELKQTINIPI